MADEFRKILSDKAETPNETRKIHSLSSPFALTPETVGDNLNSCRPFVNDRLNSRLAQTLPVGDWTVRSDTSLEPGLRPKHILHASDRIIIQGDGPWQLFDRDCNSLARGYLDSSDVLLDAANKLFYLSDAAGMIEAYNLDDGNRAFSASLLFGHAYYRSFMARINERMIVVSTEREIDLDSEEKLDTSTIEVLKFDEEQKIDQDGILTSVNVVAELIRKTLLLLSAFQDETLVVATENQICLINLDLQIKTAINGEFTPLVMSLNDAGIVYLVVTDNGVPKLRSIKPNGERIFSAELPEKMLDVVYPPIITYDHRVFLIKDDYLMAFNAGGRCLWEYKTDNPIAGPDEIPGTADDTPNAVNLITQVTVRLKVASTENDEQTGKPAVITLSATF
ncbi:MAG: hypothetical protein ABJA66_07430, partial [Actinomycetota bacterium]